jgi:photosystem II stability/assembly factor-like uncharacterized protein
MAALAAFSSTATYGCIIPIGTNNYGTNDGGGPPNSTIVPDASIPPGSWSNVTSNLKNMPSQCGNLSSLWVKPDEDMVIAGVAGSGLWATRNGGTSWQQLDTGTGAEPILERPRQLLFDPDVPTRFWEAGIYGNLQGVFETTDDGNTFKHLANVGPADSISVDFTDPMRRTLLAGGHEMVQTVQRSADQGMTFTNVGQGLSSMMQCTFTLVIDAQTHLVGCGEYNSQGIYRTTNGGMTWSYITMLGGALWPLVAHDGSIYWSTPNSGAIGRSTDKGVTWTEVTPGGTAMPTHPIELPDNKRIATLGQNPLTVIVSSDQGKTWFPASPILPYNDAQGVAYSAQEKAFFIWHETCGNGSDPVPPDAIERFDFDYTKQ